MSEYVKQYGRVFIYALPLIAVAALLLFLPSAAEGGSPYSDPFWTHTPRILSAASAAVVVRPVRRNSVKRA